MAGGCHFQAFWVFQNFGATGKIGRNFVLCFYFDDVDYGFCVFNQAWYGIDKYTIKSDHMWFGYRSLEILLEMYDGLLFYRRGGTMTVSFRIDGVEEMLEVRKCGVRLVYEGDETSTCCTFPHGVLLPESECSSSTEEEEESDSG